MKGLLLDVDYETRDDRAVIRLFLKGAEGSFVAIDDFVPYFYVRGAADDAQRISEEIKRAGEGAVKSVKAVDKRLFGKPIRVFRVEVGHPQDVPRIRDAVRDAPGVDGIYEHDILFVRRYLIDRRISPLTWLEIEGEKKNREIVAKKITSIAGEFRPSVMAFDIETYNPSGGPIGQDGPIIMISLASSTGLKKVLTWKRPKEDFDYVEVLDDEKAILLRFSEIVNSDDPDILVGYNTDNFDFPYIASRQKKLDINLPLGRDGTDIRMNSGRPRSEARLKGRVHIDLYPIIRRSVKLNSYVLENVVFEILGIKKEKLSAELLWKYWEEGGEDLGKVLEYSMEDAETTLDLSEKFLPFYYELSRLVGQSLHSVSRMTTGQLVEWLLMKEASRNGEVIPNRPAGAEFIKRREESYAGGYVKEPKKGISEDIAVFDFRSLYPSIIVTHNIDPSTLVRGEKSEVPGTDYSFSRAKGFIPEIIKDLIDRRMAVKSAAKAEKNQVKKAILDGEQDALKILANSFYGYMGYSRARWYKNECAESVAALARMYIQSVMKVAEEEFGFEVIYGDTDSLFVVSTGKKGKIPEFLEHVNKTLPGILELEYEGFYKRGIFVTKKRYALISDDDKITIKGLEFVRRDWTPLARTTQKEVLEILLKEASPEKAYEVVRKVIDNVKERKVSIDDVTLYTQLTKSIASYKNIEPHVVAAKKLLKKGRDARPGMRIGYVIVKGSKLISERAEPAEFASIEDYDPTYYIENQILPAVIRIFEAIGYSKDYLRDGIKQESMDKWF
ncbi:MAG: DNA-directed DNA polymerase [Candidatus Hydrothermarchaeaceae archaeon]